MRRIGMTGATILCLAVVLQADAPRLPQFLRLQGHFTDTRIPLTDNLPVRFSIWDTQDGYGNLMWDDIQNVSVQNDTFLVILGKSKPLPPSVFSGGDRWVELQIGSDAPLRPRYKIPYQYLQAQVAAVQVAPPVAAAPIVAPAPPAVVATPAPVVTPAPAAAAKTSELTDQDRQDLQQQIEKYQEQEKPKPVKKKKKALVRSDGSLATTYQVLPGDTLKSIAQKLYGNAELWYDLYYLNRDRLGPMGHLFTGQILVLPTPNSAGAPK